jgi:ketosteroid isomerase-like protein
MTTTALQTQQEAQEVHQEGQEAGEGRSRRAARVALSEENVQIARQLGEALRQGLEHDDPGAMFDSDLLADDWEWVVPTGFEGRSVWRGRREYVEFLRTWMSEFEEYSIEFEELIDAGDDRVVVIYRQRGTGKGSGAPVEWLGGLISELRHGRVIRTTAYFYPADALEAAGLSE